MRGERSIVRQVVALLDIWLMVGLDLSFFFAIVPKVLSSSCSRPANTVFLRKNKNYKSTRERSLLIWFIHLVLGLPLPVVTG